MALYYGTLTRLYYSKSRVVAEMLPPYFLCVKYALPVADGARLCGMCGGAIRASDE